MYKRDFASKEHNSDAHIDRTGNQCELHYEHGWTSYLRRYYPGTIVKTQSAPLNLKSGEEKEVEIRLEPDPNALPERCGMPAGSVVKECCPSA